MTLAAKSSPREWRGKQPVAKHRHPQYRTRSRGTSVRARGWGRDRRIGRVALRGPTVRGAASIAAAKLQSPVCRIDRPSGIDLPTRGDEMSCRPASAKATAGHRRWQSLERVESVGLSASRKSGGRHGQPPQRPRRVRPSGGAPRWSLSAVNREYQELECGSGAWVGDTFRPDHALRPTMGIP